MFSSDLSNRTYISLTNGFTTESRYKLHAVAEEQLGHWKSSSDWSRQKTSSGGWELNSNGVSGTGKKQLKLKRKGSPVEISDFLAELPAIVLWCVTKSEFSTSLSPNFPPNIATETYSFIWFIVSWVSGWSQVMDWGHFNLNSTQIRTDPNISLWSIL